MNTCKYILLTLSLLSLCSCEDFLVERPQTSVDKENVYHSLSSAKAVLAGCYSKMSSFNYYGFNYFHVVSVSSGVGVGIRANDVNLTSMNILPSDVNMTNAYNGMYETVNVANDIIEGMSTSTIKDESEKSRIIGEAHLIRANTYFNLVRLFGELSIFTKPVTSYSEAQQPRSSVDKVYELIVADLIEAFERLPEPENRVIGYPHKYAAKALLSKVYLTLAGNEEGSDYWSKAYEAALDVYNNGGYQLVKPYDKLFGSQNKNNVESIFEIQFSAEVLNSGRLTETTFPVGHDLMCNIITEGRSWGKTRPSQLAYSQFDEGDPRLDASFVYGNYTNIFETASNKKIVTLYPTTRKEGNSNKWTYKQGDSEYPAWKKYYDTYMTASGSSANFVVLRYADLLLILAEAANEIGDASAVGYVNQILDRARDRDGDGFINPTSEIYPLAITSEEASDRSLLRERIFRERLKEFTGECDEWYTIRRRGVDYLKRAMIEHNSMVDSWYESQSITSLPKYVYKYTVTEDNVKKNMLMPFPSDEINRNENISQEDQNFGY